MVRYLLIIFGCFVFNVNVSFAQQKLAPYISLSPGLAAQPFHAHFEKALAWGAIHPEAVLNPTFFVKNLYSISGTAGLQYRLSGHWQLQSGISYLRQTLGMYTYGNTGNPPSASQWFRIATLSVHSIELPLNLLYQLPIHHNLNSLSRIGVSAGYFANTDGMYWATGHAYRISHYAYPYASSLISTGLAYVFPNASAFHLLFDFQRHFTRNHAFSYNYSFDNFDTVFQNMTEGEKFRYWRLGITLSYVFNTRLKKEKD